MVYAVVGGEYSDWYLVGYCESREKAEEYCKIHNVQKKRNELYVMEMPDLEKEPPEGKRLCYCVDTEDWSYCRAWECDDGKIPESGIDVLDGIFAEPDIYIWIYPSELKRIIKIAQDKYAEWKAEREGII